MNELFHLRCFSVRAERIHHFMENAAKSHGVPSVYLRRRRGGSVLGFPIFFVDGGGGVRAAAARSEVDEQQLTAATNDRILR